MAEVPIGWYEILKRTGAEIYRGHTLGWAAELAYFFLLAVFPALLFVVSLATFLPVQTLIDQILNTFVRLAPGDLVAIARNQLVQMTHERHTGLLVISFVGTIWSTSSGMATIIDTLNQAHHMASSSRCCGSTSRASRFCSARNSTPRSGRHQPTATYRRRIALRALPCRLSPPRETAQRERCLRPDPRLSGVDVRRQTGTADGSGARQPTSAVAGRQRTRCRSSECS
jgi:hypothetical protein